MTDSASDRIQGLSLLGPLIGVVAISAIKITTLILGYNIVKLGYEALLKGVEGKFDFGGKLNGKTELRLAASSPGLLFLLLGICLMAWAVFVDKPVSFPSLDFPVQQESHLARDNQELRPEPLPAH